MKKIIIISTLMISFGTFGKDFSFNNQVNENQPYQMFCMKVGTDGSGAKVGTDGSGAKVGTDGSGAKVGTDGSGQTSICQIINIEEKESFFKFGFNRY